MTVFRKFLRLALPACLVLAVGCAAVPSDIPAAPEAAAQEPQNCPAKVARLGLATLGGDPPVLHGKDYATRAATLQRQLHAAQAHMDRALGLHRPFTLVLVGEADWLRGCLQQPYGIPYATFDGNYVFMAGDADNFASRAYAAVGPMLAPELRTRIERHGRTFEVASRHFADLIGFHEVGHLHAGAYGVHKDHDWLGEFVASYLAYDALLATRPEDATLWQDMNVAFSSGPPPAHTSLEDFNRLYFGVGPENYGWYQGMFQRRVAEVHARRGIGFIKALKAAGIADETDDAALLRKLDAIEPGFGAWADSLRKMSTPPA